MEWVEELVSKLVSSLPGPEPTNRSFDRLAALSVINRSKRFRGSEMRGLREAFRGELNGYIAAGNRPSAGRTPTEEILHHHQRIDELTQLVELRSTEEELENLDRNHKLGYIKDDEYLHRHDQLNLRRNVLLDNIREEGMNPLVDVIEDEKAKSRMRKVADTIASYKDVLQALAEIAGAAGRKFITG